MELNLNNNYRNIILLQVNDTLAQLNYTPQRIIELDSIRRKIGLYSIETLRKITLYWQYNIEKFRLKSKNETEKEYIEKMEAKSALIDAKPGFIFYMKGSTKIFFKDGDKDHKSFNKIY